MTSRIFFIIILIANGFIGFTQASLSGDNAVKEQAAVNNIKSKLSAPFGVSGLSNFISNVSVCSFFREGVNGKLELHGKFKAGWTGGLTIDQKIGKTDEQALPLSLTGISPGTTLQINLQKMLWHPGFNRLSDEEILKMNNAQQAFAKRNNIPDPRTIGLRDISINGTAAEKKMALTAFNDVSFKEPVFINAKLGFTKTSFSYTTDSIDLKEVNDAYVSPTFTISLIKALGSGFNVAGFVALSYNYSENYTAAQDVTFSIPFGSTSNYYTSTLAFGKPAKHTNNSVIAEYRKNIEIKSQNGDVSNLAIAPSVTVNIDGKMLSAFVPVYFIKNSDEHGKLLNNLQGGVRFGYITSTQGKFTSFNKGFLAQVIISAPLDFLDNL